MTVMSMFRHQNIGQNVSITIVNKSFKMWQSSNVWKQEEDINCINKEIMNRFNFGNICYHSLQNLLSS